METNKASQQFGQRKTIQALKMAAVVLGVIVFGYLAGTLGQYPFPHSNAASAVAIERRSADAGSESGPPDLRLSMPASLATDPRAEKEDAKGLPRECDLRQGIDSACIFN